MQASKLPEPGSLAAQIEGMRKTPVPDRPTKPLVPVKVLVLGLCRTGSLSMRVGLMKLGYNDVFHMVSMHGMTNGESNTWARAFRYKLYGKGSPLSDDEWNQLLSQYEAITDVPAAQFPGELMDQFPNAKIILTLRDSPEAWHKSMLDTVYRQRQHTLWMRRGLLGDLASLVLPVPAAVKMMRVMFADLFDRPGIDFDRNGDKVYRDHNELVKRLASDRGRDVLVFNVKEGWGPLCKFLEKEVPEGPFPRVNDTAEFNAKVESLRKQKSFKNSIGPLLLPAIQAAGAIGVAVWLWRKYKPA